MTNISAYNSLFIENLMSGTEPTGWEHIIHLPGSECGTHCDKPTRAGSSKLGDDSFFVFFLRVLMVGSNGKVTDFLSLVK